MRDCPPLRGAHTALAAASLSLLALSGCHTTKEDPNFERVDFKGHDGELAIPNLRVIAKVDGDFTHGGSLVDAAKDTGKAIEDLFSFEVDKEEAYAGLEIEYWGTSGSFTSTLTDAERLDPHGTADITGPGVFETELDLHMFSIGAHGGVSAGDLLVLDGTIGLGIQAAISETVPVTTGVPDEHYDEELIRLSINFGGTIGFTPIVEWLMFYARFMGSWGLSEDAPTWLSWADVGVELTVFPGVSVYVAHRWINYVADRDDDDAHRDSDYDVAFDGVNFGLLLRF